MDMARRRVDLRLDEELLARLDAEADRLGQTRTKFVERALESALGEPGDQPPGREVGGLPVQPGAAPSSASSRAPVVETAAQIRGARQAALNRSRGKN